MPYVLQNATLEEAAYAEDQVPSLPPQAVAIQGAATALAGAIRAIGSQRRSKAPCNKPAQENGLTPCEEKKRLTRLQALRQRG